MKKRLPILILLAAAAVGLYLWKSGRFSTPDNRIVVSGNLELTLVDLSFKIAGRMTELNVKEGDWVKKGQVIARLDPAQLQQQRVRDIAAISNAQSNYDQLNTTIQYQEATLESDIATRRAELAEAQAKLDELLAGSRPQEIQQAEASLADARAQLDWARSDWDRAQTLYKNEDISTQQFDQARQRFNSATAQVQLAEQKSSLVKEGPRKEDIAAARAQVARSQAAVATAEANRIELARKRQELVARRAQIEQARGQAGISDAQLNDTVIYAPIDGVVLVKSAEAGEVLAAGTTIVTVGDLDHPWLRAYIGETELGRVKLGQKVKLSTDSYPGKYYAGTVSFISAEAEFTPKQIQTKEERVKLVYRIKVDVDNTAHELKNNMPVDAEIQL
ncbi:MAG TPA: HlyD family efflux transporter periplasmic adaptor subunit [Bryobacteraceae bacterium]|nr:HlyD family efflux transporter periplasmic adaptor subunit [Bryobacteraceae bacterium]